MEGRYVNCSNERLSQVLKELDQRHKSEQGWVPPCIYVLLFGAFIAFVSGSSFYLLAGVLAIGFICALVYMLYDPTGLRYNDAYSEAHRRYLENPTLRFPSVP